MVLKYRVWVDGQERETARTVKVERYPDGGTPTAMKVKAAACKSIYFGYKDYTKLRIKRVYE